MNFTGNHVFRYIYHELQPVEGFYSLAKNIPNIE
jgi:hypothetical protein